VPELLAYLRAIGFKIYIVSGGGIDFMRLFTEQAYGIPPEQVVGSVGETRVGRGSTGAAVSWTQRPMRRSYEDEMRSISWGSTDVAPIVLNCTRTLPSACVFTCACTAIPLRSPRTVPVARSSCVIRTPCSCIALRVAAHERSNVLTGAVAYVPGATS
jgi:hypothetical protein